MKREPSQPPRMAQALLPRLLPPDCCPGAQDDLDEKYCQSVLPRLGRRRANRWYWRQVLALLHPRFWLSERLRPSSDLPFRLARPFRSNPMMSFLHDLRFGIRMLAKAPGVTLVAVLALALGIGANGTFFTFLKAVLMTPLPISEPEQAVFLECANPSQGQEHLSVSLPDFRDWKEQSKSFQDLAAFRSLMINLSDADGVPERLQGLRASANLLGLLGEEPLLGRSFTPQDAQPQAAPVALIGHATWQRRYGGDPSVLGRTVQVNQKDTTVVGVLPPVLERTPLRPALWIPLRPSEGEEQRDRRIFIGFARLKPEVSLAQARLEMEALGQRLSEEHPETNRGVAIRVQTFQEMFGEEANTMIAQILMASVALVLLIACANVANLLLSRSALRAREVAIRSAMGAGRWRLFRQLFLESLLLSVVGGAAGLLLAVWGSRAFESAIAAADPPPWWDFSLDGSVLAFLALLCLLTTLLFGSAPALQAARLNVNDVLKEGGRGQGSRRRRLTQALVLAQLALTLALLASAGLTIRTALKVTELDFGIGSDPDRLLTARLLLSLERYPEGKDRIAFHDLLAPRIASLPGVASASMASTLPGDFAYTVSAEIEGMPQTDGPSAHSVAQVIISPGYFQTLRTGLLQGRSFNEQDGLAGEPVAIVDAFFAQRFWPGEGAVGKRLRWVSETDKRWMRVVGVSPVLLEAPPAEILPQRPMVFTPYRQEPIGSMTWVVASQSDTEQLTRLLRSEVQSIDPNLPLDQVRTAAQIIDRATLGFQVVSVIFALLSAVALLLSSIGLYAVIAQSVNLRRQEIGVRMALGARSSEVLSMVLGEGLKQTVVGIALGLAAALALGRVVGYFVVGVSPWDPLTFVSIVVLLTAVVIAACLIPARRASRVDPVRVLRTE